MAASAASALRSTRRQARTMRSTCSAVPARPTPSSRSSVSGFATRVSARTLAYDSSPRASACASRGPRAERAGHADTLARRARVEPDAPGQPRGARAESVAPAAARVEVADEVEQVSGGGVEVGGQLGDLVAEPLELHDVRRGRYEGRSVDVHRRVLHSSAPTLHRDFRLFAAPPRQAIAQRSMSFRDNASRTPLAASVRPAGQPSTNRCRLAAIAEREGCQAKFS